MGAFAQVLLITFCWQLTARDGEGLELEVSGERLLWGRAGRCSSQWDPLPALGLFKSHPGAQHPANWGGSPVLGGGGPGLWGTAKAPVGGEDGSGGRPATQRHTETGNPGLSLPSLVTTPMSSAWG